MTPGLPRCSQLASAPVNLPIGRLDQATSTGTSRVRVSGWALDRDPPNAAIGVHFYIGATFVGQSTAGQSQPDVKSAVPGADANNGYVADLALPTSVGSGQHHLCAFGINTGPGQNSRLEGCRPGTVVSTTVNGTAQAAVNWANSQIGRTDYDLWCLKFVADAYQYGAKRDVGRAEYARLWWDQRAAAQRRGDMNPPAGALVFWSWTGTIDGITRDWGHTAISRGDGTVVSSAYDGKRGIQVHRLADLRTNYLGWIMP